MYKCCSGDFLFDLLFYFSDNGNQGTKNVQKKRMAWFDFRVVNFLTFSAWCCLCIQLGAWFVMNTQLKHAQHEYEED